MIILKKKNYTSLDILLNEEISIYITIMQKQCLLLLEQHIEFMKNNSDCSKNSSENGLMTTMSKELKMSRISLSSEESNMFKDYLNIDTEQFFENSDIPELLSLLRSKLNISMFNDEATTDILKDWIDKIEMFYSKGFDLTISVN